MRVHGDPWISWVGVIVRVYYTCACVRACLCVVCIVAYVCFVLSKCMFRACSLPQVCINSHSFILVCSKLVCVHVRAYPDIRRLPRSRAMFSSIHMYTYTHSHTHTHTHTYIYMYPLAGSRAFFYYMFTYCTLIYIQLHIHIHVCIWICYNKSLLAGSRPMYLRRYSCSCSYLICIWPCASFFPCWWLVC